MSDLTHATFGFVLHLAIAFTVAAMLLVVGLRATSGLDGQPCEDAVTVVDPEAQGEVVSCE